MTVSNPTVVSSTSIDGSVNQLVPLKISSSILGSKKPKPQSFSISAREGKKSVSYEELFAHGHGLWLSRNYIAAITIFELLAQVKDRGPRASILLSHCYAMEQKFGDCSRTLCDAFPSEECGITATELHNIFVMWKCTFFKEVRRDLEDFVNSHPELPTPALLLADFFMLAGRFEQSLVYVEQAIERDRIGGAVAMAAKIQRDSILKKLAKKKA